MTPTRQGSLRLFRIFGIDVFLHWSWFLVAVYSVSQRLEGYTSPLWGVLEYLALFLIVLTHEFGHALACRSVGGRADQIVLWPLGGVAYVDPPARPGAYLWSIAAGPLVNVVLLPVLFACYAWAVNVGWPAEHPDAFLFVRAVAIVNLVLLVFNLLPIYPLDGGQILRSLLWFFLGAARSLMVATAVGLVGGVTMIGWAAFRGSLWTVFIGCFMVGICWRSFVAARGQRRMEKLPRRPQFVCPSCRASPPIGTYWACQQCRQPVDLFETGAVCPRCGSVHEVIPCPDCGQASPLANWGSSVHEI